MTNYTAKANRRQIEGTKHQSYKPLTPGLRYGPPESCISARQPAACGTASPSHTLVVRCAKARTSHWPLADVGKIRECLARGENSLEADKLRKGREGRDVDTNQRCRARGQEKGCWDTVHWTVSTKRLGLSSHSSTVDSSVGCYLQLF